MLLSSLNSSMRLVSYETGSVLKVYRGHTNVKYCTMSTFVSTLGPRPAVASGSEDGSIFVWDLNSKKVWTVCGCGVGVSGCGCACGWVFLAAGDGV